MRILHSLWPVDVQQVGSHGERSVGVSVDQYACGTAFGCSKTGHVHRGQEVVRRRDGAAEVRMFLETQDFAGAVGEDLARSIVESARPIEPLVGLRPVDGAKVVHDIAAAEDQDAPLAELLQSRAKVEVIFESLPCIDRQLQDRNVCFRE